MARYQTTIEDNFLRRMSGADTFNVPVKNTPHHPPPKEKEKKQGQEQKLEIKQKGQLWI